MDHATQLKKGIFFNSAGASLMPLPVIQSIKSYLDEETRIGGYKAAERHNEDIKDFYKVSSSLIDAKPHNIAFTTSATDAYARALDAMDFEAGDIIITTDNDYASNHLAFLSLKQRCGIEIRRIPTEENAQLDMKAFRQMVDQEKPKLVAVTHVPTNSGLIQDVQAVGEICRELNLIYLVDACQSVGQMPVDVNKIGCDFLTATGRKFLRGPRGTGFLYVSDRILERDYHPKSIDGAGAVWSDPDNYTLNNDATRFEFWEKSYALMMGFTEAIRIALEMGIDTIQQRNSAVCDRLRQNLLAIPGVTLYDEGQEKASILTLRKKGVSLQQTKTHLDQHEVYYSISQYNWALLDFQNKGIDWALRLSPHYFNTMDEADAIGEIIQSM